MNDLAFAIPLAFVFSGFLVWFLRPHGRHSRVARSHFNLIGEAARPAAKHYQYFPQIRQALSSEDMRYLLETAPPHIGKRVLRERRTIARHFLRGLHEDFSNLARIGRVIASLSPAVSREQEMERLLLMIKFQILYALVWLQLVSGILPLQRLEALTRLVGKLATRMEDAVAAINAATARQLPGDLSA